MVEPLLEIKDLRVEFDTRDGVATVIDGLDISLYPGEILGIVGESGCGKSMTALSVMRLVPVPPGRIAKGTIRLQGEDLLQASEKRMREVRGTAISIRKFSEKPITLDNLKDWGAMSEKMATALKIAGACRFNIVISGGTGSGKTTMLNALSKMIDPGERVLTIEDAAELRLQQPHWLPLETRPPNLEGKGAISIGDLVKNALRMRPDRIILGEIRGAECFDLLAAMNTGHDGSMCTLHANSPREALGRMENMILMGDIKIPKEAISRQIAESVDIIVQVKRLRDGSRRVTNVTEVIGMEGEVIVTQELFKFEYLDEGSDGKIIGEYRSTGLRPYTLEKARQFGFEQAFLEACL